MMQQRALGRAPGAPRARSSKAVPGHRNKEHGLLLRPSAAPVARADVGSEEQRQEPQPLLVDPEQRYRRLGNTQYAKGFRVDPMEWFKAAPRVRIRTEESRKIEDLLELAALNERLAGNLQPWEVRHRLDFLRSRHSREHWDAIYEYITQQEVAATLDMIEEAGRQIDEAMSDSALERTSVGNLKGVLQKLQTDVMDAQRKLDETQARVEQNLQRVNALKAEAAALERVRQAQFSPGASAQAALGIRGGSSVAMLEAPSKPSTSGRGDAAVASRPAPKPRDRRALRSTMELEPALRNFWFPCEFSSKLTQDMMVPFECFGEPWVLFRDENGRPACIKDQCAHRACPLSVGKVVDGHVQCPYHGWTFNGDGSCVKMPSTTFCKNVSVAALPCVEKDGFVWVWPGNAEPSEVPDHTRPPAGYDIHAEIMVDVPVEHGLLIENLLDLAHAPFTHVTTFARGWPVPDAVKFHAEKLMSGNWDPYPIDMSFHPPCMTVSLIGLQQPGKLQSGSRALECSQHLHQLHVCMPSKKGHTRLLYRMSMDFMGWIRHVPFIQTVWKKVAAQVLGEDLVLVLGQQDRMQRGADTWANPVAYDKIGVRYRRWRNSTASGDATDAAAALASIECVSAGEMFSSDECELLQQAAQQPRIRIEEEVGPDGRLY